MLSGDIDPLPKATWRAAFQLVSLPSSGEELSGRRPRALARSERLARARAAVPRLCRCPARPTTCPRRPRERMFRRLSRPRPPDVPRYDRALAASGSGLPLTSAVDAPVRDLGPHRLKI